MSIFHRILRKPFFGRFEVPWVWPTDTAVESWERVSFISRNGAQLQGLWGKAEGHSEEHALGNLVLAHPMGKAAKGFWLRYGHAQLFRKSGFNVFVFDANGFGESEAHSFDYPSDILSAGLWAQQRQAKLKTGLVGASFGAAWGLCSMANKDSPYRAAILEAAFPTLPEFWHHYPVAHAALRLSQWVWPSLERNLRPERLATMVQYQPQVMLIYGEADIYTPPSHGQRLQQAFTQAGANAELITLAGVDHTFAFQKAPDVYAAKVLPFLRQHLHTDTARN